MTIRNLSLVQGVLKLNLSDSEYRALEATSFSDMVEFERYESGNYARPNNLASKIGVQFHDAVLGSSTDPEKPQGAALPMFQKLIEAPFFQKYLRTAEKNVTFVNLSKCGMLIKGRLDMVYNETAIDLVSTKAESLDEFIMLYHKLQYSRKASFYLGLTELKDFLFIGVQRQAPYNVYTIECGRLMVSTIHEATEKNEYFLHRLNSFLSRDFL